MRSCKGETDISSEVSVLLTGVSNCGVIQLPFLTGHLISTVCSFGGVFKVVFQMFSRMIVETIRS
jgi:hypothetical protein